MPGRDRVIVIIPARGGSKRIPRKNIIPFNGKPMIAWTIEAALSLDFVDRVLVSTDDDEIRKVAQISGAQVPFLRDRAFDDFSTVSEATLSALLQAEQLWGKFDVVIQLMPNCPLRTASDIREAYIEFTKNDRQSQVSFFEYGFMNPWWAHKLVDDVPTKIFEGDISKRSQDLEKVYCPTGAVWISKANELKDYGTFYSPNMKAWVINWVGAVDIDDNNDLMFALAASKLETN